MATDIATTQLNEIERVLVTGDLSKLTPEQRTAYYSEVCKSLGLNPLTKPFEYITLNGKLTLYANRNCAEQLRRVYGVSITDMEQAIHGDILTVTVKGLDKEGRADVASGAVCLAGLKGENLANAYLKAETKAKRRLTLSLCGLGMLDETEVETIPTARKIDPDEARPANPTPRNLPAPNAAASGASPSGLGVHVKRIVQQHGLKYQEFTESLFEAIRSFYTDALDPLEGAGWKDKGAAMGVVFDGADSGDKEAIIRTAEELGAKLANAYEAAY